MLDLLKFNGGLNMTETPMLGLLEFNGGLNLTETLMLDVNGGLNWDRYVGRQWGAKFD